MGRRGAKALSVTIQSQRLWSRIGRCSDCHADPRIASRLGKALPDDYLVLPGPGVLPPGPRDRVAFMVVAQEPSAGKERSRIAAQAEIDAGFRNFNNSVGDLALQYAIERWLIARGSADGYVITDLSKCQVRGNDAACSRPERYGNCLVWLQRELALYRPDALVAVGNAAEESLRMLRRLGWPPIYKLLHYSWQTHGRRRCVAGRDLPNRELARFKEFVCKRYARTWHKREASPAVRPSHALLVAAYRTQLRNIGRALRRGVELPA